MILPVLLVLLGTVQDAGRPEGETEEPAPFLVERSDGRPLLALPPDEELVYAVHLDVAFLEAAVGTVTQTSTVEPHRRSVLLAGAGGTAGEPELEAARLSIHAEGEYALYRLDSTIEARHLPDVWPRIVYSQVQRGGTMKRRENRIGLRDGVPTASFRRDTATGAPRGARIWKEEEYREIPPDALDMLSAVFAARTLVQEGLDSMTFPMVEKDRLWEFTIRRGEQRLIRTGAGTFAAVEILLDPAPWPDEEIAEEKVAKFEGLFGMQGGIHLWAERTTGVTVRIQGDLPAGPLTLGIDVVLESYRGTPEGFAPVDGGRTSGDG